MRIHFVSRPVIGTSYILVLKFVKTLQRGGHEEMLPRFLINPSGIAPVAESCLTKVKYFWEWHVSNYRSKAKDKGLGILVPPGLTLTGHFSSKATGWGQLRLSGSATQLYSLG